jgi:hypothetical protein
MTWIDARQIAQQHPGIIVKREKRTWAFYAQFKTTYGRARRYAGKDINRAIALRSELISAMSKAPTPFV